MCQISLEMLFSPQFWHNMPLPWQRTFYHCPKMCLAHLHPKANICAKFHENWSKTEEVVHDARFAKDRLTDDTLIPIPPSNFVWRGYKNQYKASLLIVFFIRNRNQILMLKRPLSNYWISPLKISQQKTIR